jgi:hypothetical protein
VSGRISNGWVVPAMGYIRFHRPAAPYDMAEAIVIVKRGALYDGYTPQKVSILFSSWSAATYRFVAEQCNSTADAVGPIAMYG